MRFRSLASKAVFIRARGHEGAERDRTVGLRPLLLLLRLLLWAQGAKHLFIGCKRPFTGGSSWATPKGGVCRAFVGAHVRTSEDSSLLSLELSSFLQAEKAQQGVSLQGP